MDRREEPSWPTRIAIALLTAVVVPMPVFSFVEARSEGPNELAPYISAAAVALAAAVLVLTPAYRLGLVVSAAIGVAGLPLHALFAGVGLLTWLAADGERSPETWLLYALLFICAGALLWQAVLAMEPRRRVLHTVIALSIAVVSGSIMLVIWFARASEL